MILLFPSGSIDFIFFPGKRAPRQSSQALLRARGIRALHLATSVKVTSTVFSWRLETCPVDFLVLGLGNHFFNSEINQQTLSYKFSSRGECLTFASILWSRYFGTRLRTSPVTANIMAPFRVRTLPGPHYRVCCTSTVGGSTPATRTLATCLREVPDAKFVD